MRTAMLAFACRFGRRLTRFGRHRRGLAALEFAMLLPTMMTLYVGCVDISTAVAIHRKVTLTAHALADLSSQFTSIAASDMTNILNASSDIIVPYQSGPLQSVVSELSINAQGQASVVWSATLNGTARPAGQIVTIPNNLAVANTYLLLGEASYGYTPNYGYVITGTITLSDQMYMQPRQSNSVSYSD